MINREIGFSMWLDFVERDFLKSQFVSLIEKGVINGATSNPAIFASAITTSPAYKLQIESLKDKSPKEKYEALAIEDIRTAAQALRGIYDEGNDGYISIEVDPFLSNDTEGTIVEGKRLFEMIGEPNVMIKVPATDAGYEAMRILMSEGISVNATLIFSPNQAKKTIDAMKRAFVETNTKANGVISVFVSRFDRLLDDKLEISRVESAKTGNYNASKIYAMVEAEGIPQIRTLFASTGVKGDKLSPDYYIRQLMAKHSINTAPLATIEAYLGRANAPASLPIDENIVEAHFDAIKNIGVDIEKVYETLLDDGLRAFENAFQEMLGSLSA